LPTVDPIFLTDEDVVAIHADQFGEFGGAQGVRDPGLLSSAMAQPCATLDFLDLNGVDVGSEAPDLFDLVVGVAAGHVTKVDAAHELRRLFRNPQRP